MVRIWVSQFFSNDHLRFLGPGILIHIPGAPPKAIDHGDWIRGLIPFYGRTIQVSEI